ncbi:MAG: AI-2E family transporter [Clostridia bacterium]|nr:AI-2E family transporter [Clostridia bacterium]
MKFWRQNKNFLYWGVTAFLVVAAAILFNCIVSGWNETSAVIGTILSALRPIIFGIVFAYVLNPLMKLYENKIFYPLCRKIIKKNERAAHKTARSISLVLALVTALAIVAGLLTMIIPELYTNIEKLVTNMQSYINNGVKFLNRLEEDYPEIMQPIIERFAEFYTEASQDLLTFAREKLLPNANTFITNVSQGIYGTVQAAVDVIIGVIVSVYILWAKERYGAQAKKLLYGFFSEKNAGRVISLVSYTDERFGGFLVGKIVDSAIIGVICFVACSIFSVPYALLVSSVIAVTNIIPFFGPFLGAIPSIILILLVNPIKALTFAILILIIQQVDGNIIGPKVLGDRTGLDSFGVMFAILLSGGLFGFAGLILGVPTFAVIFGLINKLCERRLAGKNLPTELSAYRGDKPEEKEPEEEPHEEEKEEKTEE